MKTQINNLRSGVQVQLLNPKINYSMLPRSTGYYGIVNHAGSNTSEVKNIWEKILSENLTEIKINIFGETLTLKRSNSLSGKSSYFRAVVSKDFIIKNAQLTPAKDEKYNPYIQIELGNYITIGNGKNAFTAVCPSFIEIID